MARPQFRLVNALGAIAFLALWFASIRACRYAYSGPPLLPRYFLLAVLALAATRVLCSQGRLRAFFLGFSVFCAAHLAGFPGLVDQDRIYRTISLDWSMSEKTITVAELTYMVWPPFVLVTSAAAGLVCALVWPRPGKQSEVAHNFPSEDRHSDDLA